MTQILYFNVSSFEKLLKHVPGYLILELIEQEPEGTLVGIELDAKLYTDDMLLVPGMEKTVVAWKTEKECTILKRQKMYDGRDETFYHEAMGMEYSPGGPFAHVCSDPKWMQRVETARAAMIRAYPTQLEAFKRGEKKSTPAVSGTREESGGSGSSTRTMNTSHYWLSSSQFPEKKDDSESKIWPILGDQTSKSSDYQDLDLTSKPIYAQWKKDVKDWLAEMNYNCVGHFLKKLNPGLVTHGSHDMVNDLVLAQCSLCLLVKYMNRVPKQDDPSWIKHVERLLSGNLLSFFRKHFVLIRTHHGIMWIGSKEWNTVCTRPDMQPYKDLVRSECLHESVQAWVRNRSKYDGLD